MSITIEQIKQLRDATGVSMTACKKALEEANGDFDKSIEILRKKGESKAADSSERSIGEGAIVIKIVGDKAVIVKLGCETDFVALSDEYRALGESIADKVLAGEISVDDREIKEVKDAVLKLGENIQVLDMAMVEGSTIGSYVHSNGKIGVVVVLDGGSTEVARDVAMHAAATNPKVLSPEEVPEELVMKEKDIWADQLKNEGKPAEIIEKIMEGKEKKFREDSALAKQPFVKNPDQSVEQYVSEANGTLKAFVRFSI